MKKKRILQLPHGYLSYSQICLWQSDPDQYAAVYFDDRQELRSSNAGMEYGKVVADALEHGIQTGDLLTDSAMTMLPKYDVADKEVRTVLSTKEFDVPILIKPDSLDSVTKNFYEYKTGKTPWTQKKAQNHLQLKYYAMGIYLEYKKLLRGCKLIWIETERTPEGVKPTGRVKEFPVTFSMSDLTETMALTARVAREIEVAWAAHVPDPRLVF